MGSVALTIFTCFFHVGSRSTLNLMDRFCFGRSSFPFFFLYFINSLLPSFIGFLILGLFQQTGLLFFYFIQPSCFLFALSSMLTGWSFSYAFRLFEVKEVVLRSKIAELFLPLFCFLPICSQELFSLKGCLPLLITWIFFLPLCSKKSNSLFDRMTLLISGSLLLHMLVCSFFDFKTINVIEVVAFSTTVMFLRALYTAPFAFFQKKTKESMSTNFLILLSLRAIVSLIVQISLTLCILKQMPLLIWPIINMNPIVSALFSQIILKEKIQPREKVALAGCFLSAAVPLLL